MPRRKPKTEIIVVNSIEEVNDSLKEIALRTIELKRIDADAEEAINKIKEEAEKKAAPFKKEIKELEEGIAVYAEANRRELFSRKKTVELTFGKIGYRKSSSIHISSHAKVVEALKKKNKQDAILIEEKANKDVLPTYKDDELLEVHASRKVKDTFWYEIKEEEITQKPKN